MREQFIPLPDQLGFVVSDYVAERSIDPDTVPPFVQDDHPRWSLFKDLAKLLFTVPHLLLSLLTLERMVSAGLLVHDQQLIERLGPCLPLPRLTLHSTGRMFRAAPIERQQS